MQTAVRRACCILFAALISTALARQALGVIPIQNVTLTDTLTVPAGETGELAGTITLDGGTLDVFGTLVSKTGNITVTGSGQVLLNQPTGRWSYSTATNILVIDPGVEVLGQLGTSFATGDTINRGTFAAVAGGSSTSGFRILVAHGFTNEGLLEARDGGRLWLDTLFGDEDFNATGTIRALPGGIVRFTGPSIDSLAAFGNVENLGGTIEFDGILNNAGKTTEFTGGDWVLMSGAHVTGGTLGASNGGRLLVTPYRSGSFTDTEPLHLDGVTLATDFYFTTQSRVEVLGGMTLNGAMRFNTGTGEVLLNPTAPISGAGGFLAEGGTGTLRAVGGTIALPAGIALRSTAGTLSLSRPTGDLLGGYDLSGPVEADGGVVSIAAPTVSRGTIVVRNGGRLSTSPAAPLTNLGAIHVEAGGILFLDTAIDNQGTIEVDHSAIVLRSGAVSGPGSFAVTDSTLFTGQNMTLSQFLAVDGTRVDRSVYAGVLDLEGAAIDVGTAPGERWTLSGGSLTGGVVNSSAGGELAIVSPATGLTGSPYGTLFDLELNADARTTSGTVLNVTGPLSGTGHLIVDGGRLNLGNRNDPSYVADLVDRIVPIAGQVVFSGPVDNVGRTITLPSGVEWRVEHSRSDVFIGGRIAGDPGVSLKIVQGYRGAGYATLRQGVTLAVGTLIGDTELSVHDGLTLDDATMTIGEPNGSQFADGRLVFIGQQTLGGTGEVHFNRIDGFPSHPMYPRINMIEVANDGGQAGGLTIGADITIRTSAGSGYIGGNYFYQLPPAPVPLVNFGTLLAENGHTLTLFASDLAQQGTLRAAADSKLIVNETDGVNEGLIELGGGTFAAVGQTYENGAGGEIRGHGQLDFGQTAFTNAGLIAPEGALTVLGNYVQAAGGILQLDVTSDAAGGSESLMIDGAAMLGGRVRLDLFGIDPPELGDSWTLLTATGGLTGSFASVTADWLPTDLALLVDYQTDAAIATLAQRVAGDYNGNGIVDTADYTVWRDMLDQTGTGLAADGNGDNVVDASDYGVWKANFGQSSGRSSLSNGAVPEPATLVQLLLAATGVCLRRRARRAAPPLAFTS